MIVFGVAGWSGSGKTTLIEKLIPELRRRALDVSVIKHAHHGFDIDQPGKDSYRHREAGAGRVLMLSGQRWVLMRELHEAPEPTLEEQLKLLESSDVVLIEGFKAAPVPKVEVFRRAGDREPLWPHNAYVVAVASDDDSIDCPLPVLPLNEPAAIANFILEYKSHP